MGTSRSLSVTYDNTSYYTQFFVTLQYCFPECCTRRPRIFDFPLLQVRNNTLLVPRCQIRTCKRYTSFYVPIAHNLPVFCPVSRVILSCHEIVLRTRSIKMFLRIMFLNRITSTPGDRHGGAVKVGLLPTLGNRLQSLEPCMLLQLRHSLSFRSLARSLQSQYRYNWNHECYR